MYSKATCTVTADMGVEQHLKNNYRPDDGSQRSETGNMIIYKNIGNFLVEKQSAKFGTWTGTGNQEKNQNKQQKKTKTDPASEMTQWAKTSATMPNDLSSIPKIHTEKGEQRTEACKIPMTS